MQHEAACRVIRRCVGGGGGFDAASVGEGGDRGDAHVVRAARRFIYSKTRDVCEELDSIGVHYSACLGEHDDCVDPPPGSSFPPRPAPRLRPLTPSQKGSFRLQTPAFAEGLPTMMFNGTIVAGQEPFTAMSLKQRLSSWTLSFLELLGVQLPVRDEAPVPCGPGTWCQTGCGFDGRELSESYLVPEHPKRNPDSHNVLQLSDEARLIAAKWCGAAKTPVFELRSCHIAESNLRLVSGFPVSSPSCSIHASIETSFNYSAAVIRALFFRTNFGTSMTVCKHRNPEPPKPLIKEYTLKINRIPLI